MENERSKLKDQELRALAFYAVGVSSEGRGVAHQLSLCGSVKDGVLHPIANSGYSIGTLQTDLGQRPKAIGPLLDSFQKWAGREHPEWMLDERQRRQFEIDLKRNGKAIRAEQGRDVDPALKSHLNAFLASADGIDFVHGRDALEIDHLMRKGGALDKVMATTLYKRSSPDDQARLATMTLKVENQTGTVKSSIISDMSNGKLESVAAVRQRIEQVNPAYVSSGIKHALQGAEVFVRLQQAETGSHAQRTWQTALSALYFNSKRPGSDGQLVKDHESIRQLFLHPSPDRSVRNTSLRLGSEGHAVRELQSTLIRLGHTDAMGQPLKAHGHYDLGTQHAVQTFQKSQPSLKVDGAAGPATLGALGVATNVRGSATVASSELHITAPDHPGHELYEQALKGLQRWNAAHDIPSDLRTHNAAAALALEAQRLGLTHIDHVTPNSGGDRLLAVQGQPGSVLSRMAIVQTIQALDAPLADTSRVYIEMLGQHHHQHEPDEIQRKHAAAQAVGRPSLHQ